ncbi:MULTISPECIES: hypothetical protein [Streptococcus]|uniref:Uncharacterized protein n=2 Tax=Streptococcus anginosus TaxID=1328 RepID=A0AAP6EM66_STRAP|nr:MULTISPECIES: hypothetical protein [Streptococcus]MCY7223176.1 hypothetical protein [Streptococcus anginosus]MDP1384434.1 hypothetical protein [Streptococcus anginosus]MDX5016349.1 hypothetical protein [Streptococcus anginosus]MDX5020407.1 hypothetical protein [Streptococcus anginosus]MDX5039650.1 hypothetical protein [Streptococcus anginosus]
MKKNRSYSVTKQLLVKNLVQETGLTNLEIEKALQELSDYGLIKISSQGMAIKVVG